MVKTGHGDNHETSNQDQQPNVNLEDEKENFKRDSESNIVSELLQTPESTDDFHIEIGDIQFLAYCPNCPNKGETSKAEEYKSVSLNEIIEAVNSCNNQKNNIAAELFESFDAMIKAVNSQMKAILYSFAFICRQDSLKNNKKPECEFPNLLCHTGTKVAATNTSEE